LQQLGGPVLAALNGNWQPVLTYTVQTLGVFTFAGDPIARYNLPGRPIFDPIAGLLFYFGLWLAVKRWRDRRNLFALLWLPIGLLPSMLSDSAPSFLRASVSLPVTFLFPALALDWLLDKHPGVKAQSTFKVLSVLASVWLVIAAVFTVRDYFSVWPNRSDVREVYRSDLAQAAKWIEQQPTDQPIVIASTNPRDLDPFLYDFELSGKHDLRWIDRAYALVFPTQRSILISPVYSPIDPTLRDRFLAAPVFISKFEDGSTAFEVYELVPRPTPLAFSNIITLAKTDSMTLTAPIDFNHSLGLLGYEAAATAEPGDVLKLTLYWRVNKDAGAQQLPVSLFVHLLNDRGEFAAGHDLLAYPTASWRDGDVWLQQTDVQIPFIQEAGTLHFEIGAYSYADNVRWRIYDPAGNDVGDRVLLSSVEIKP
jgi:hypothetical protein